MSFFRFSPHRIVPAAVGLTAACVLGLSTNTAQAATPVVHAGEDTNGDGYDDFFAPYYNQTIYLFTGQGY